MSNMIYLNRTHNVTSETSTETRMRARRASLKWRENMGMSGCNHMALYPDEMMALLNRKIDRTSTPMSHTRLMAMMHWISENL